MTKANPSEPTQHTPEAKPKSTIGDRANTFEQSFAELETIVTQLEKGELTLEDSLKQFEKGIHLAHSCQSILNQAELKIEQLSMQKESDSGTINE